MLPQPSHRPRIAVIDDDQTQLQRVQEALARAGYEPRTCPDWALAPLFVAEAQPALVILQSAPRSERRGWRVLDELKHAEETESIPVMLCSALAPALDTLRHTLVGYRVQLMPPQPNPRQLLAGVRRQLAQSSQANLRWS